MQSESQLGLLLAIEYVVFRPGLWGNTAVLIWKIALGFCLFFLGILSFGLSFAVFGGMRRKGLVRTLIGVITLGAAWAGFASGIYALFWDWGAARYAWICFGAIIVGAWLTMIAQAASQYRRSTPRGLILNELQDDRTLPQLVQLVEFIRASDSEARRDHLARTTGTLARFSDELDVDQRYLFDRMLVMLARSVDASARARLAVTIAAMPHAPRGITRVLAYDDDITVAGPILRASTRLDESDLIAIAKTKTREHVREITQRSHLGTTLSVAVRANAAGNVECPADVSAPAPPTENLAPEIRVLLLLLLGAIVSCAGMAMIWMHWDAVLKIVEQRSIKQDGLAYLLGGISALIAGDRIFRRVQRMARFSRFSHSRAIFRAGWMALGIGATLLAMLSLRAVAIFVWSYPPGDFEVPLWVLASGCVIVLLKWGGMTALNRQFMPPALEIMRKDRRPPVLYLRSFARELAGQGFAGRFDLPLRRFAEIRRVGKVLIESRGNEKHLMDGMDKAMDGMINRNAISGGLSFANLGQSYSSGRGRSYDEQLVIANLMNRLGPYVAFGRPTETFKWADVGAAKLYVSDSGWHHRVIQLIEEAAAIVIEADASAGLAWEIGEVVRRSLPIKLLIVLPRTDEAYLAFLEEAGHFFPVPLPEQRPQSRLLSFSEQWRPIPLKPPSFENLPPDFRGNMLPIVLRPFLRQNAFELTPSRLLRDKIMNWGRMHFPEEQQLGSSEVAT